jgi:hypothetical protein
MTEPTAPTDGWATHRIDQIRRTSSATPLQRLRWLEEAIMFAFHAGAIPEVPTTQPRVS